MAEAFRPSVGEKMALLALIVLWGVCFTLSVRTAVSDVGYAGIFVKGASGPEEHPRFIAFRTYVEGADSPLRAGDRIVRLGDRDLRGLGAFAFVAESLEASRAGRPLHLTFEREGVEARTTVPVVSFSRVIWPVLPVSLSLMLLCVLGALRIRSSPGRRAMFLAGACLAILFAAQMGGTRIETFAFFTIFGIAGSLTIPLVFRALLMFPYDEAPAHPALRFGPWIFAVLGPVLLSMIVGVPLPPLTAVWLGSLLLALAVLAFIAVTTFNYRRADPAGRRQMRWVLYGVYCVGVPIGASVALSAIAARFLLVSWASFGVLAVFPVFFLIAVTRYNLFDVDRLISATTSYTILSVLFLAGALVLLPRLAEATSGAVGIDPSNGHLALSLLFAGALVPVHRRLRPQIDRLFFAERYALDRGTAELLPALSTCSDARELTERVGAGLRDLFRPDACIVYAAYEETFSPVFVDGRAVPPAFEEGSALIGALRQRRSPLAVGGGGRRPDEAEFGPFERAALDTMRAEVIVPVRRQEVLTAFMCLGPKRSGDVYTSTDLSLLAAVGETVSSQLTRFDQETVIREARDMQRELRRYVPGAIADQLEAGESLARGEREVSVLFVDIRGYTSFSESRHAEEIFSTVNRYTETVSEIVRRHGGSVVEFNGDGMMVVFGAPRDLAHKERAAVEAGRELIESVGSMTVEDSAGGETALAVGVGVATGSAFVGNIQAVDRAIWTAIGNTTNLAARLQSLTRELDAAFVIDHTTWQAAGAAAAEFEVRERVPIRGRRETQDLYLLS